MKSMKRISGAVLLLATAWPDAILAQAVPTDARIKVSIVNGRPEITVAKPLDRINTRLSTRIRNRIENRLDASTLRGFSAATSLDEANYRSRQLPKP